MEITRNTYAHLLKNINLRIKSVAASYLNFCQYTINVASRDRSNVSIDFPDVQNSLLPRVFSKESQVAKNCVCGKF
jgi:hypothetical protein